jgi:hypothetical protein
MLFYSDMYDTLSTSLLARFLGAVPLPSVDEDNKECTRNTPTGMRKSQMKRGTNDSASPNGSPSKPPSSTFNSPVSSPLASTFKINFNLGSDNKSSTSPPPNLVSETVSTRTPTILPLLLITLPLPVLITYIVPVRLILLFAGWGPILIGHPYIRELLMKLGKGIDVNADPVSSPGPPAGLGISEDEHIDQPRASSVANPDSTPIVASSTPRVAQLWHTQVVNRVRHEGVENVLWVVKALSSVDGEEEAAHGFLSN